MRQKKPAIVPPERHDDGDTGIVYDSPMLNEEMLLSGVANLMVHDTVGDEVLLQRRLQLAAEQRKQMLNKSMVQPR